MYREILVFLGILSLCLFMTVHNNNLLIINERNLHSEQQKLNQENFFLNEGVLIKLSNGATLKIDNNLIIIEQSNNTIILNSKDANQIVAFLEN